MNPDPKEKLIEIVKLKASNEKKHYDYCYHSNMKSVSSNT
jgi:hypothetical protein